MIRPGEDRLAGMTEQEVWALAEAVMSKDEHLTCWLRWNGEFSSEDIGRMLGLTRQGVDARLKSGREKLRQAVESKEEAA